jgi:Protein of unknown function (DUF3631)
MTSIVRVMPNTKTIASIVSDTLNRLRGADNELAKYHAVRDAAEALDRFGDAGTDARDKISDLAIQVHGLDTDAVQTAMVQGIDKARMAKTPSGRIATSNTITSEITTEITADNNVLDFRAIEPSTEPPAPIDPVNIEVKRLASLSGLHYERERKDVAQRFGLRASILDDWVKAERAGGEPKGQGRTFNVPETEPWTEPVEGAECLSAVAAQVRRYIAMPPGADTIVALWAMHTWCFDCFQCFPRLAITSPEKGCGKTTLLDVLGCLVRRPLPTSNATVSAIFRIVEKDRPTLLIDEADTFLKENDELRGILNSGHRKGGSVLRTVGDNHEPRVFSTEAPAAIAMIGQLPDTLEDRSVSVSLRRRKPTEHVESFRFDRTEHLRVLARKMMRWATDNEIKLAGMDPDMGELQNRMADNWRCLFAIADSAGGTWPAEVRRWPPPPWRRRASSPSAPSSFRISGTPSHSRRPTGSQARS